MNIDGAELPLMDILDYTESTSTKTVDYLRRTYDDFYDRMHKLVTALMGGAAAVGAYSLGKVGQDLAISWVPIGSLSVAWFVIAFLVLLFGPGSRELSPGNGPKNLLAYHRARLAELSTDRDDREAEALRITREKELELQQGRLKEYAAACTERARVLDRAYLAIAVSPLIPLLVLAGFAIAQRFGLPGR